MHPQDDQLYPVNTIVRLKKTGEFARITDQTFQFKGRGFLHYLGEIEGRQAGAKWCLFHDEVELEALPESVGNGQ